MSRTDDENALLGEVRDAFQYIGYGDGLLREDYEFADYSRVTAASPAIVRQIELAALTQPSRNLRNVAIGVAFEHSASAAALKKYRDLGAPQILILHRRSSTFRRWILRSSGPPEPQAPQPLDRIAAIIREHEPEWNPQSVFRAKTFPFDPGPAQLDFADAGLIPAIESDLRAKLSRLLTNALGQGEAAYQEYHDGPFTNANRRALHRLVFRLLTAKLLIDRQDRPEWAGLEIEALLDNVEREYLHRANPAFLLQDRRTQKAVWHILNEGLHLQNLSIETLADVYERALVLPETRGNYAIHATPAEIAEYVVRRLPLETLPENERRVFEPFCGHAPFLTAAMKRFRDLPSSNRTPQEWHTYFKQMLSGIEFEALACEIAFVALTLTDEVHTNGWNVVEADAFHSERFDALISSANAVFCNPPYRDVKEEERERYLPQRVFRTETEAARRIIAAEPRMFALVLPRTVLDRDYDREWRNALAATYRNIAVIALPDNVFRFSQSEALLIMAHNEPTNAPPYFFGQALKSDYARFQQDGSLTWRYKSNALQYTREGDVILWQTTRQPIWDALAALPVLDDVAKLDSGIRYESDPPSHIFDAPQENTRPGIAAIDASLEPYAVDQVRYLSVDPAVIQGNTYDLPWDAPKVLLNRVRVSRDIWCLAGAVETRRLRATRQFYGVWSRGEVPVEVLAAVLNGPVANAFMYDFRTERDNYISLLERIPVPRFSAEQTDLIVSLVNDYRSDREWLRQEPERAPFIEARCRDLLLQIDAAVLKGYGLTAEQEAQLLQAFEGVTRPLLPFRCDGYGEDFTRAKRVAAAKLRWKTLLSRYHALVNKEYDDALTSDEAAEKARLWEEIDRAESLGVPHNAMDTGERMIALAEKSAASVPDAVMREVPTDYARNYKHYIHGWAKAEA